MESEEVADPYNFKSPTPSPQLPFHLQPSEDIIDESPEKSLTQSPKPAAEVTENIATADSVNDLPAFSLQTSIAAMQKQLEIQNVRTSNLERMFIRQQETMEKMYAFITNALQPQAPRTPVHIRSQSATEDELPTTPVSPPMNSRRHLVLPDFPSPNQHSEVFRTPTASASSSPAFFRPFEDSPASLPDTPTGRFSQKTPTGSLLQRGSDIPIHLFSDIPEQYQVSQKDLDIAFYSTSDPGNFAVKLLRLIFPELFTSDNLRALYSYKGGTRGKEKKNALNPTKKHYLRRYVIAFYPDMKCDRAYQDRVVTKINGALRRPVTDSK